MGKASVNDYKVLCHIGKGGHGACDKVQRKRDGKKFVWKTLHTKMPGNLVKRNPRAYEQMMKQLSDEVDILSSLDSPYIVRYYDYIYNPTENIAYIVMEYCPGGDLSELMEKHSASSQPIPEAFVWKVLIQMVHALDACHNPPSGGTPIMHRDVKALNIFLDANGTVKLGDFGVSRELMVGDMASTFCGTQIYMAPEIHKGQQYTTKCDIFSLGCVLHELCTLTHPFIGGGAKTPADVIRNIRHGKVCSTIYPLYSKNLRQLIASMLENQDVKRPCAAHIRSNPIVLQQQMKLEADRKDPNFVHHTRAK